jgi:predicted neutral ceramidase superfamily lipid hydrolase
MLFSIFVHGGGGWAKILFDNDFADKGYAYLAFLSGIIIGTLVTSLIADTIAKYIQTQFEWATALIATTSVAVVLVLLDLEWRFYRS